MKSQKMTAKSRNVSFQGKTISKIDKGNQNIFL